MDLYGVEASGSGEGLSCVMVFGFRVGHTKLGVRGGRIWHPVDRCLLVDGFVSRE
jgi:hypothetical protein